MQDHAFATRARKKTSREEREPTNGKKTKKRQRKSRDAYSPEGEESVDEGRRRWTSSTVVFFSRANVGLYYLFSIFLAGFLANTLLTDEFQRSDSQQEWFALAVGVGKMTFVMFKYRKSNPLPSSLLATIIGSFVFQFAVGSLENLLFGTVPSWLRNPAVIVQHIFCFSLIFWSPADIIFTELQRHLVLQVSIGCLYTVAKVRAVHRIHSHTDKQWWYGGILLSFWELFGNTLLTKLYVWLVSALYQRRRDSLALKAVKDFFSSTRMGMSYILFATVFVLFLFISTTTSTGTDYWKHPLTILAFSFLILKDYSHLWSTITHGKKKHS